MGQPSKITADINKIVEGQMQNDDEASTYQLHQLLVDKGYNISLRTILWCRTSLCWTFRSSAYCQLIREVNKTKRLQWAIQNQGSHFDDVVWTDVCMVQLESHRRFCCRKVGQPPKNKPRYSYHTYTNGVILFLYRAKHPVKVHVWARISLRGANRNSYLRGHNGQGNIC